MQTHRAADKYSPLYFLSSVGAGGLAVTFFMYLMFWVPHPGRTVPVFEDIAAAWQSGSVPMQVGIAIALVGISVFAVMNVQKLAWNLQAYARFKKTEAFRTLRNSNAETTLLAYPLALAMTVNALFIVGLVFVPNLWSFVEYLFPFAMVAFLAIGMLALSIIGDFLGRVLTRGGLFDVTAHNSFAQMLPTFALSMVAVGLSAPAAMSGQTVVVGVSMIASTFFAVVAILYALVALVTAFNSMLHYGTAKESAPTLMILVPIVTTLGIMFLRQSHGMHTTFEGHTTDGETMVFLARLLSVQVMFLALGLVVLKREGYWSDFVFGSKTSPGSYALVCPGVALSVMIQFFLHKGLIATGLVAKFGIAYWSVEAFALGFQVAMVVLVLRLNRQHFAKMSEPAAVPAE
ncbi:hypothetical protein [Maritimibacter sp. DP1N21-5]|uniref:TsoY family (seleno)protein n=1 Tax=Maritimibacter sp. DP1N21-5 TaxID=2836867 RepID=UPI001C44155B|nr:hypothetical protein [Maritimibacter sp. DP1N21-5]MBV7408320.1 hypothetical protein [Maritimibacter sp. DP1N21-5]